MSQRPIVENVKAFLEPRHDLTPMEIDAVEDTLYEYNRAATGRHDGKGLGFILRDEQGKTVGLTAGYTWAGISEFGQMWVHEAFRGRGYGRAVLDAMVAEAQRRSVGRIWVARYDFQAPGLYERAAFKRVAELEGWPEGHVNVIDEAQARSCVPKRSICSRSELGMSNEDLPEGAKAYREYEVTSEVGKGSIAQAGAHAYGLVSILRLPGAPRFPVIWVQTDTQVGITGRRRGADARHRPRSRGLALSLAFRVARFRRAAAHGRARHRSA